MSTIMNKILVSLTASCLILIGACTSELPEIKKEAPYIDRQESILKAINSAADWQLKNMDNFDTYIPSFIHRTIEKRGWVQGAFFLGLARWAEETNNTNYFNYLRDHGHSQNWQLGDRRYHADDHVVAQFYLHLHDLDKSPESISHLKSEFDSILADKPVVSLDFNPHSSSAMKAKDYERACQLRWCWADALFMSPPAWFHLSKITGDDKYLTYADQEYKAVTEYLLDPEYNLYFRDSRFLDRREKDGSKIFWSRGNGWVYSGLTQMIDFLPINDPRRDWYIDLFKRMSLSLKELQFDNGYWPVSLAAGDLYKVPETSGTAFFISGLAWGLRNNHLNEEYFPTVKTGWQALLRSQLSNGMIGSVQQVGYAPDKVSPNETQLYGAGAFLLAGTEILALEKSHTH